MITSVNANNRENYIALFEEAADTLSGYQRVRTFDADADIVYYYKDIDAEEAEELFKAVPGEVDKDGNVGEPGKITSLSRFAEKLEEYKILYIFAGVPAGAEAYDKMAGITTLEEYFSWLGTLSGKDKKYTVLPLDENHFEINANTRAITIPADFKKNGIAVQGDDLAEVLYFEIDRYFDYMDLDTCDIFIQWEIPKSSTATASENNKFISPAYIKDISSKPGKLIFGWVITDEITANAGTLKFSVRFFKWTDADGAENGSDKSLAYSFSTLVATVPIQPSINFNLAQDYDSAKVDNAGERLLQRIDDSEIVGGYAAATPIFEQNLDDSIEYDLEPINAENAKFPLSVYAYSSDTGSITYSWRHQLVDIENNTEGQEIISLEGQNVYIGPEGFDSYYGEALKTLNRHYAYYFKNDNDIYIRYNGDIPVTNEELIYEGTGENKKPKLFLYRRVSRIEAEDAGQYWAIAKNRITNSSTSAKSKVVVFPKPVLPEITTPPAAGVLDVKEGFENKVLTLTVDALEQNYQEKAYQWMMYSNSSKDFDPQNPSKEDILIEIDGATTAEYDVITPGHYAVKVTNWRNKHPRSISSEFVRVTPKAEVPQIKVAESFDIKGFTVGSLRTTNATCPKMVIDTTGKESDLYEITWYHRSAAVAAEGESPTARTTALNSHKIATMNSGGEDTKHCIIDVENNTITFLFNPVEFEDIIKNKSEDQDLDGIYYAIITNKLNTSDASTSAPTQDDFNKLENCFFVTE